VKIAWHILSYIVLFPSFLLVSIELTVIIPFLAFLFDLCAGQINQGTFGKALTSSSSRFCRFSMSLSSSMLNWLSASQSSSLLFGLSESPYQSSQFSLSEIHSDALSSSLSAAWQSILLIRQTSNTWIHPPRRSFAAKAGGQGDVFDNVNPATPSRWKVEQDALTISSVSEMYPMAVICSLWARDFFCVECRFWLPCHISLKSCTLAILCKCLSSTSLIHSKSLSVFVIYNGRSSPDNITWLAGGNWRMKTYPWRVSPVVIDCLQPIMSHPKEKLASTPTQCGIIGNILHTTLETSVYVECVSWCWCHQSVLSSIQTALLFSIRS